MRKRSVFIVGAGGMVGATAAYAIAIKEIVSEIVLIDVAEDLVQGQASDINHATAFTSGVNVRVGSYSEIQEDDIVIITSGTALKPGQTRLELVQINAGITRDVVSRVMAQGKPVYILMVANPVDVLTYIALKTSGLPKERVFGTGTTVDTARLRVMLANKLDVSQRHVHAYILGEHGDSSFPALANANIGGIPLEKYPGYQPGVLEALNQDIRTAAYKIVEVKKSTWGIGNTIASLVAALSNSTNSIYTICSILEGEYGLNDVVIGVPSIISTRGVRALDNYPLSETEAKQLQASAKIIRSVIDTLQE